MTYIVESIPVAKVHVGERRREKVRGVAALKASLESVGQIHPITVRLIDGGYELVAGQCRLEAARALGWTRIRARVGSFSDDQMRQIELEENTIRDDLTSWEASKERGKQIDKAEQEAEAKERVSRNESAKVGRPSGGNRAAARRLAIDEKTVRETRRHLAAGHEYPFLQASGFSRDQAIDLGSKLDALPQRDRETIKDLVSEPGVPESKIEKIITNAAALPSVERKETLDLYRSGDEEQQSLAKTRLAKTPPRPWHRLTWLRESIDRIERTLEDGKRVAQGDLRSCLSSLKSALKESEQAYQEFRRSEVER